MTETSPAIMEFAESLNLDASGWYRNCHVASLHIVQSDRFRLAFPNARVARGWAQGVDSQHSWVSTGDPYDDDTQIFDATLCDYREDVHGIWTGKLADEIHVPHGYGFLLPEDYPTGNGSDIITIDAPMTHELEAFLRDVGPLDAQGWMELANGPMQGWPSPEAIRLMRANPLLRSFVPIDIAGMLTDENPGGLYR